MTDQMNYILYIIQTIQKRMMNQIQIIIKEIAIQSKKKYSQIEKFCNNINLKEFEQKQIGQILQNISGTKNKKLLILGLRLIDSIILTMGKITKQQNEAEMEYIFTYLDIILKQEQEQIKMKLIQCISKLMKKQLLNEMIFRKLFKYFCAFINDKSQIIKSTSQNCLYQMIKLLITKQQFKQKMVQAILKYLLKKQELILDVKININELMINILIENYKIFNENQYLRFVECLIEGINNEIYQYKIDQLFKISKVTVFEDSLDKIYSALFNFFIKYCKKKITNYTFWFIKNILIYWMADLTYLQLLTYKFPNTFNIFCKTITFLEDSLPLVSEQKEPARLSNFIFSLLQIPNKLKNAIQKKYNLKAIIQQMQIIRPLDNIQNYMKVVTIVQKLSPLLAKILVHISKWGDQKTHIEILNNVCEWINLTGVLKIEKPLICFLKIIIYTGLPKRQQKQALSEKNIKSISTVFNIFEEKIYILNIDSITMILKFIQSNQKFFLHEEEQLKTIENIINLNYIDENLVADYKILRSNFKYFLANSHLLHSHILNLVFQGLTQVALDTLDKIINQQKTLILDKQDIDFKTFSLDKIMIIMAKNEFRIKQLWATALNIFVVYIKVKDSQLSIKAIKIFNQIVHNYFKYEISKHKDQINSQGTNLILKGYINLLENCKQQNISVNSLGNLLQCVTQFGYIIVDSIQYLLQIMMNQLQKYKKSKKILSLTQSLLILIINDMIQQQNFDLFQRIIQIIKLWAQNFNKTKQQHYEWKLLGTALTQLLYIHNQFLNNAQQQQTKSEKNLRIHSLNLLQKSASQKSFKLKVNKFSKFEDYIYQILLLIYHFFISSQVECKMQYIKLLELHLIPNIFQFKYQFMMNMIMPLFNKLLTHEFDFVISTYDKYETPTFVNKNYIHQDGKQHEILVFKKFIENLYSHLLDHVIINYAINWNKKKYKIIKQLLQTFCFIINKILSKNFKTFIILIIPLFTNLIKSSIEISTVIIKQFVHSMLKNMNNWLINWEHQDIEILNILEDVLQVIISLCKQYNEEIQSEILTVYLNYVIFCQKINKNELKINFKKVTSVIDEKIIMNYFNKNLQNLTTNNQTKSIRHEIYEYLINLKINNKNQQNYFDYIYHPREFFQILNQMKVDLSKGIITFCKQQLKIKFKQHQIDTFSLQILLELINNNKQNQAFVQNQIKHIFASLIQSQDRIKIINEIFNILVKTNNHQLIYFLFLDLSKKYLKQNMHPLGNMNDDKINQIEIIISYICKLTVPQSVLNKNHHIQYLYEDLLTTIKLNKQSINQLVFQLLIKLTQNILNLTK